MELKTLGAALVQLRERESEITSVSGALAGNRAGIRSRKPQSCWGADLGEEARFVCGHAKCDLSLRHARGGGSRLWESAAFGGSSLACKVNFGDCGISVSLK